MDFVKGFQKYMIHADFDPLPEMGAEEGRSVAPDHTNTQGFSMRFPKIYNFPKIYDCSHNNVGKTF